jgi:hypothetical protein
VIYVSKGHIVSDLISTEPVGVHELDDGSIIVYQVNVVRTAGRSAAGKARLEPALTNWLERAVASWISRLKERPKLPVGEHVFFAALAPDVADQVTQFALWAVHDKQVTERLVKAMFTQTTVSSAAVQQARRNAEARQELIDEFGLLEAEELAEMVGSKAKNRSATASRWLTERRVFAVEHLGRRYFPAFQFGADGRPRAVIKRVVEVFEPYGLDGWELALWFTTVTGWLDDKRPVDRLSTNPDDVVAAAQHTFDEVAA